MARKKQTSNPIVLSDGSIDDGKGRIVTTSDGRKVKVDALASSEYWRRREARQQTKNIRDEQKIGEEMKKIYLRMFRESQTQIDAFYQRYADKNGITLAEARKRVSQMDINAYAAKAKKYVKDRDLSDQANEEMALYNLTMKVNRLEMLKAEMGMALVDGFEEMSGIIDRELTERAMSEYERKAGILGKTVQNPAAKAAAIVNASFHNATWSERLWSHQEALKMEIGRQLMSGLIAGKSSRDMAREIRKIFGGSLQNAQRLMVTELARVQTEAARQSMEANGNTEYEYMATGPHPCPECMKLDGEIFKLKEMQVGVNAPPLHPSCHCCTAPHVDEAKWERRKDFETGGSANDIESYGENPLTDIDYSSAYTFANGATRLINTLLSGKHDQVCNAVEEILNGEEYGLPKSHWSGKTIVGNIESMMGILGRKEYNCDITIRADQRYNIKTYIHENLHARSISRCAKDQRELIYNENKRIEEGVIEYLSQEICKKSCIPYIGSYSKRVEALRSLKAIIEPETGDYEFAKRLIEIPVDKRYNELKRRLDAKAKDLDKDTVTMMNKSLHVLRPGKGGDVNAKK